MRWLGLSFFVFVSCTPIDAEKGYGYSCQRQSTSTTQCPGDFHCGLENKCIKNEPGAWQCESDIDCYGWHCGVDNRCYDLVDAGAVACRADSDCDEPAGWRCSPDRRCVNAADDALVAVARVDAEFRPVSFDLWTGPASHVEATESQIDVSGLSCRAIRFALTANDELLELVSPQGEIRCLQAWSVSRTALARPRSIALNGSIVAALMDDGGVSIFTPSLDGGFARMTAPVPPGLQNLRVDDAGFIAFNDDTIVGVGTDGGVWSAFPDAGALVDVAPWSDHLLLVTNDAIFRSEYEPGVGSVSPPTIGSLRPSGCVPEPQLSRVNRWSDWNFGASRTVNGVTALTFYERSSLLTSECPLLSSPYTTWQEVLTRVAPGECVPAVPMRVGDENVWRCLNSDGGIGLTGSQQSIPVRAAMTARNDTGLSTVSFAGAAGALWFGTEFSLGPATLDRTPSVLTTVDQQVLAIAEQNDGVVTQSFGSLLAQGATFTFSIGALRGPIAVRGQPGWFAGDAPNGTLIARFTSGTAYGLELVAQLNGVTTISSAAATTQGDGGTLIVVGSGDLLMHGTKTSSDSAVIQAGVVPSSRLTITAVSPREDALGARYAGGYLVAGGRLFRFTADNPVVWRSEEIFATDDEVIDVWTQNGRSRAGYRDGSLIGLPSRVRIAGATTAPVHQFIPVCDRLFALTDVGLEQLVEGQWEVFFPRVGGGRAVFAHGKLTVVWSDGSYGELAIPDCAQ